MRVFGAILILIGAAGVALTAFSSVATVSLVIAATGLALSGAIFFVAGEIVAEMRLLAKWLNDEQQRRFGERQLVARPTGFTTSNDAQPASQQ